MARAPRTPRATFNVEPENTPIEEALINDQQGVAGDLTEILESLRDFDQGSIKGILYRKPNNGIGRFEWIEEITPPFDMTAMFTEMKERFGGGDFQLRIFAGGRIRKNIDFTIVKERQQLVAPQNKSDDNMALIMQMMMNSQMEAARESRAAADRQMQMMMQMQNQSAENARNSMTAIVSMMTAGMSNGPKMADLIPLLAAKEGGGSNLKEMVETLAVLKGLTDPAKESAFNADDIVGSVLKVAGPVAGAIGRAASGVMERRGAQTPQNQGQPIQLQEQTGQPLEFPTLPNPTPQTHALPAPAGGPAALIALIRPDVNYFFGRRHDVELAAEAVYGVISAALDSGQVTENDLNDMVTAFMGSPDWIGELAGSGIDLRADPAWAQAFIFALVSEHTNAAADFESGGEPFADEGNDDRGRASGGDSNPGANGQAGAPGLHINESATTRGDADNAGLQ